jgi:hypothetical protein
MDRQITYDDTGQRGWFDRETAELVHTESRRWNGQNLVGAVSGLQTSRQELWRTAGGRWVLHRDASCEFNGADEWSFATVDDAQAFLEADEAWELIETHFGETVEPERGPGRPEVGPAVHLRLTPEQMAMIDNLAAETGKSRAATIRDLLDQALPHSQPRP